MNETIDDVLADVDKVFRFEADATYQGRAHDYLRRRKVDRSYEDTAVQRVVIDLVERAARTSTRGLGERMVAEATSLLELARDMKAVG